MNPIQRYFAASVLYGSIFLLTDCPPKQPVNTADTSPPGFTQVVARLEAPSPPNPRGEFDVTSADVSKVGIGKDLAIRVIGLAGDTESAIKDIAIVSNLTWQCSGGHNAPSIGIVESVPLAFSASTQPASPVTPLQINVVANPIAQTGCDMSSPGKGPINIRGFVRLVATNGAGLSTTSKTFIFDYANVGNP